MRRFIILYMVILVSVFLASNLYAVSADDVYKVGVNDILNIQVLDHATLNTQAAVSSDGNITFPYLGNVYVKGKNIAEIEDDMEKRLGEGYVKFPVVSVSLLKSYSRKIFTYGEFSQRGQIAFEDNMTLLNALSIAGGVSADGLHGLLKIKRKKKGKAGYDDIVETTLNNGRIENAKIRDTIVQLNDILILEKSKTFLMQGEVAQRGRFVLEKGMTVLRALLQAGGVSNDALYGSVIVRRKSEGKSYKYKNIMTSRLNEGVIENPEVENTLLHPDDILIVEKNKTFLIQGEVMNRGRFALEKSMTVLQALLQAGGVSKTGLNGSLKIRRQKDIQSKEYTDIKESRLYDGVIESQEVEDMLLKPDDVMIIEKDKTFFVQGEVMQRGRFVLEKDMTVINALLNAGGVADKGLYGKIRLRRKGKNEYENLAESGLNKGVIMRTEVEKIQLQPNDILIIEPNDTYFLYGEIPKPGEYVLESDMTTFDAIILAGGFTKWGSASHVKILRNTVNPSGQEILKVNIDKVIDGYRDYDVYLKAGDKIIVSAGGF